MATSNGPKLGLLVDGTQGDEHYAPLMARWRGLDTLIQANVIDHTLDAMYGFPADGDSYIVGTPANGDWTGHSNQIARWNGLASAWEFYTPKAGWRVWSDAAAGFLYFTGTSWASEAGLNTVGQRNVTTFDYTLVADDFNKRLVNRYTEGENNFIIPTNATLPLPAGTTLELYNDTGANLTVSTGDELRLAGTTDAGDMLVSPNGWARLFKPRTTRWAIEGAGVTLKPLPPAPGQYYASFGDAILTDTSRTLTINPSSMSGLAAAASSEKSGPYKVYVEFSTTYAFVTSSMAIGITKNTVALPHAVSGMDPGSLMVTGEGQIFMDGSSVGWASDSFMDTNRFAFAFDFSENKVWILVNNVPTSGDPATNTGGYSFSFFGTSRATALISGASADYNIKIHALAADQLYAAPSGFTAWDDAI